MQKITDTFNHFQATFDDDNHISRKFYVNRRENVPIHTCLSSYRRDFYKISFITKGEGVLYYGDKIVSVKNNTMIISNPRIPFKWEPTIEIQEGYFCLFTESFIQNELKNKSSISSLLYEYENRLSIHVNHLNRALKKHTEKTTSQLISERVVLEAKSLLLHTDWDISQIAFCLGFQYPPNFQAFFKKQTNISPKEFKQANASNS